MTSSQDEPVRHQAKNSRFKKGYHSRLLDFSDDDGDDDDNDKEYESSSTYMDSVRQEHKSNKQYGFGHDLGIVRFVNFFLFFPLCPKVI